MNQPRRRLARERGSVLALAAVGIVLAVTAVALAVDLGAHAWKKRDLQKVADLVAIDTTYALDELSDLGLLPLVPSSLLAGSLEDQIIQDRAQDSALRNGFDPHSAVEFLAEPGIYTRGQDPAFEPCDDVLSILATCQANAVRVTVADPAPRFFSLTASGPRVARATATATMGSHHLADISVGSFAGRMASGESPFLSRVLAGLIGADPDAISADVISYQGLAHADITLEDLAAQLTGGDVDALFRSEITYAEMLDAMVVVLEADQDHAAEAQATATIRQQIGTGGAIGAITGTVTDAGSGSPIAGAVVSVPSSSLEPATTDSGGFYRIENVAAGPQSVRAEAPGYESSSQTATVEAEQTTSGVDFALAPGPPPGQEGDGGAAGLGAENVGAIAGLVRDGNDAPLEGATVTIGGASTPAVTNASGNYVIENVAPGAHTVVASLGGYGFDHKAVTVEAQQTATANFTLQSPPPPGHVGDGGGSGTVDRSFTLDERLGEDPRPEMPVNALDLIMLGAFLANGDNAVEFTIDTDLPEGIAKVEVRATLIEGPSRSGLAPINTLVESAQLRMEAVVTLDSAFTISTSDLVGGIEGTVTDAATGEPIVSAEVTLDGLVAYATTDQIGDYTITNVAAGAHTVTISAPGYATQVLAVTVLEGATVRADAQLESSLPPPGQEGDALEVSVDAGDVSLTLTGDLQGTVRDADSAPLASATVSVTINDGLVSATSDADGFYRIRNVLAGVPHVVTASRPGYESATTTVTVPAGGTAEVDFELDAIPPPAPGQVGDGGAAGLENTIATSDVEISVLLETARSSAAARDIDCRDVTAQLGVRTGPLWIRVGGLPQGSDFLEDRPSLAEVDDLLQSHAILRRLHAVSLDAVLQGLLDEVSATAITPDEVELDGGVWDPDNPYFELDETRTYRTGDPTSVGLPISDVMSTQIDLQPLVDAEILTQEQASDAERDLNRVVGAAFGAAETEGAPVIQALELVAQGFGVSLFGTDATLHDIACRAGTSVSRFPILVE